MEKKLKEDNKKVNKPIIGSDGLTPKERLLTKEERYYLNKIMENDLEEICNMDLDLREKLVDINNGGRIR